MRYLILIEPTATGFSGHVPDLPGCIAAAESREETVELLRDAVALHLEEMHSRGDPLPAATSLADYVDVDVPMSPTS